MESERPIELKSIRLLVCVALWYRRDRLRFFFEQVRCLAEMPVCSVELIITTQTTDSDDIAEIRRLLVPFESTQLKFHVISRPKQVYHETYYLTWEHKKFIEDWFLDPVRNYTHFIYMEDDIRFSSVNLAYFVKYLPLLAPHRLMPAFLRVEYNHQKHALFYTDLTVENDLGVRASAHVGGLHFVNPINPYCAVLVLDIELAKAHVASPAFHQEASKTWGMYGTPERASIGFTFDGYPYDEGFSSRYVVPVLLSSRLPLYECIIEHLPGNFTNKPITEWLIGHTPFKKGFVGSPPE